MRRVSVKHNATMKGKASMPRYSTFNGGTWCNLFAIAVQRFRDRHCGQNCRDRNPDTIDCEITSRAYSVKANESISAATLDLSTSVQNQMVLQGMVPHGLGVSGNIEWDRSQMVSSRHFHPKSFP